MKIIKILLLNLINENNKKNKIMEKFKNLKTFEDYTVLDHVYPGYDIFYWKIIGESKDDDDFPVIDKCYLLECTEEKKDEHVNEVNSKNYSYYINDVKNMGNDTSKYHWKLKTINTDDYKLGSKKFFGNLKELKNHMGEINSSYYSYTIINFKKKN